MEFAELLKRRKMVRAYERDPIPRETLERIVATVRRAPSGGFSQGQRLVVVTEAETREAIARLLDEEASVGQGREPWLAAAPAHVVVCTREQDYHDRYNRPDKLAATGGSEVEWPVPFWFVDAGAAMMLILLAAIDEGLAAGVYGVTVEARDAFKRLLGIPPEVWVVAGVTLGRPADDSGWRATSSATTQRRRSLDELVHWERW